MVVKVITKCLPSSEEEWMNEGEFQQRQKNIKVPNGSYRVEEYNNRT